MRPEKGMFSLSTVCSGNKKIMRTEKRSVEWMVEHVFKFFTAGNLVLSPCTCSVATADPCLWLSEYQTVAVSDTNCVCFQDTFPSLVKVYARPDLGRKSSVVWSKMVIEASMVSKKSRDLHEREKVIAGLL